MEITATQALKRVQMIHRIIIEQSKDKPEGFKDGLHEKFNEMLGDYQSHIFDRQQFYACDCWFLYDELFDAVCTTKSEENYLAICFWCIYGVSWYDMTDFDQCNAVHEAINWWPSIDEYHYMAGRVDGSLMELDKEDIERLHKEFFGEISRPKQLKDVIQFKEIDGFKIFVRWGNAGEYQPLSRYKDLGDQYVDCIKFRCGNAYVDFLQK